MTVAIMATKTAMEMATETAMETATETVVTPTTSVETVVNHVTLMQKITQNIVTGAILKITTYRTNNTKEHMNPSNVLKLMVAQIVVKAVMHADGPKNPKVPVGNVLKDMKKNLPTDQTTLLSVKTEMDKDQKITVEMVANHAILMQMTTKNSVIGVTLKMVSYRTNNIKENMNLSNVRKPMVTQAVVKVVE